MVVDRDTQKRSKWQHVSWRRHPRDLQTARDMTENGRTYQHPEHRQRNSRTQGHSSHLPPHPSLTKKNGEQPPARPKDGTPASTPPQQLQPSVPFVWHCLFYFILLYFIFYSFIFGLFGLPFHFGLIFLFFFFFFFAFIMSLLIKARVYKSLRQVRA